MRKLGLVVFCVLSLTWTCSSKVTLSTNGSNLQFSNVKEVKVESDLKTSFDGKGLDPWYNLAKSFIHTVQKDDLPYDDIKKAKDGDFEVEEFLKGWEMPFLVTAGIGVFLAIVMPIVGLCFCCCRCCGNCGGEMSQKQSDKAGLKRAIFGILLSIITLIMFTGCLMAFVSNDRITDSVDNFKQTPISALDAANDYFNQTLELVTDEVFDTVLGVLDIVLNKVIKLPDEISTNVKKELQSTVEEPLKAIIALGKSTDEMKELLENIKSKTETLKTKSRELEQNVTKINKDIKTNCPGSNCPELAQDANFTNLPDVSSELNKVSDVVNQNITENAEKGLDEFNKIGDTIKSRTANETDNIKKETNKARDKFTNEVKKDIVDKINKEVFDNTDKWKKDIDKFFDDKIHPNDRYRYYAGVGFTCLVLLPVVLMALGLLCGIFGHDKEAEPTERGRMSHTGGNCLMAAVGFLFIFVFFLMLFTALFFLFGAHVEKGCSSLRDGDFIADFLDNPSYWDDKYIVADAFFNNGSIELTVASILKSCRDNDPLYKAIQGEKKWNLADKFNVKKELGDFEKNLDNFNVSIDDQKILDNATKKNLEDLGNTGVDNIDFSAFFNETKKDIVPDLDGIIANLSKIGALDSTVDEIKIVRDEVNGMKRLSGELESAVKQLKTLGGDLSTLASTTINVSKKAEKDFEAFANTFVSEEVKRLANTILGWIQTVSDRSIGLIENDLGRCEILTDIYDAVVNLLCREAVYPFNGFWFAIGFCLFFYIPAIIFSVKLAKHYRRMQFEEGFDRHTSGFEMSNVGAR